VLKAGDRVPTGELVSGDRLSCRSTARKSGSDPKGVRARNVASVQIDARADRLVLLGGLPVESVHRLKSDGSAQVVCFFIDGRFGRIVMADQMTRRVLLGSASVALAASAAGGAVGDKNPSKPGPLKIIGVSCSPRKGRSTADALRKCLQGAKIANSRVETELIELAGLDIDGSLAAGVKLGKGRTDDFPGVAKKLADPSVQGIIIGTPVYFSGMTSLCKAFIERLMVFWRSGGLAEKVVGVVAVGGSRNGGQEVTIRSVQDCLFCYDMVLVGTDKRFGATVWSGAPGGDKDGMQQAEKLGRRVAETAIALKAGA